MDTTALINFRGPAEIDLVARVTGFRLVTTAIVFFDELIRAATREAA